MRQQFHVFLLRWVLNTVGLWVAVRLFGPSVGSETMPGLVGMFLLAGLIFSVINTIIRPIVVIFALPAILLTLKVAPGLDMTFTHSILAGIIMSLVNYIVSSVVEVREQDRDNKVRS